MKKLKLTIIVLSIITTIYCIFYRLTLDRPMRIVQRQDNQYEVERYYGLLIGWSNMGGPFRTLKEAEERCIEWRQRESNRKIIMYWPR